MAAEGRISELKIGSGIKITIVKSPKVLWDDCLDLESYIRSNSYLDIFQLDGMTHETNILGETYDITTLCEFGWYQWVYFRDTYATFPGDNLVLGKYCGPSLNVGPALTANILKNNGEKLYSSTYRALTPDQLVNPDDVKTSDEFDLAIEDKLGPAASDKYFECDPYIVTLTLDRYEDDEEHQTHMPEVDDIMPETMVNYIGAEIMISHGDKVAQGIFRCRKRYVEENSIGKAIVTPFLILELMRQNLRMGA